MEKIIWRNERRKVSELAAWDKNPRKITDEQLEHLKASIDKFGYAAPILVDSDNRIIAGHMRVMALIALGRREEEVDVRQASRKLSADEFKELSIRDNANTGSFDLEKLCEFGEDFLSQIGVEDRLMDSMFQIKSDPKPQMVQCPKCENKFERKGNSA